MQASISPPARSVALTERELEIFTQLASGHSNHQIGDELEHCRQAHHQHARELHLENRIQAAVQAVRSGIS